MILVLQADGAFVHLEIRDTRGNFQYMIPKLSSSQTIYNMGMIGSRSPDAEENRRWSRQANLYPGSQGLKNPHGSRKPSGHVVPGNMPQEVHEMMRYVPGEALRLDNLNCPCRLGFAARSSAVQTISQLRMAVYQTKTAYLIPIIKLTIPATILLIPQCPNIRPWRPWSSSVLRRGRR